MNLHLRQREIGVWIWSLAGPDSWSDAALGTLSGDELKRAGQFLAPEESRRFVAARAGIRRILGGILGKSPDWLCFEYSKNGKPSLACQRGKAGLRFSLSHSGDVALLVAAYGLELGADLEHEQDGFEAGDVAGLAFSPSELDWLQGSRESERQSAFFRIWTLKEAVLKAKALGMASGLGAFQVLPDGSGSAEVFENGGDAPESWRAHSFSPAQGLHAAVAYVQPSGGEFLMAYKSELDYPYSKRFFGVEKNSVELCLQF